MSYIEFESRQTCKFTSQKCFNVWHSPRRSWRAYGSSIGRAHPWWRDRRARSGMFQSRRPSVCHRLSRTPGVQRRWGPGRRWGMRTWSPVAMPGCSESTLMLTDENFFSETSSKSLGQNASARFSVSLHFARSVLEEAKDDLEA